MASLDSFKCRKSLTVGAKTYEYFSLKAAEKNGLAGVSKLPFSMKIVLENLLRNEDGRSVKKADIEAVVAWLETRGKKEHEIAFRPARVLMQDFTGVPAVVDLAAMRDAMVKLGGDPTRSTRSCRSTSSSTIRSSSTISARQGARPERQARIRTEPGALPLPQVGPAGVLQFLRRAARRRHLPSGQPRISRPDGLDFEGEDGRQTVEIAYPDTLVGTDSHTTMVNGLAVLGWGVGGIEAEAAMLGQPLSMLLPEVSASS